MKKWHFFGFFLFIKGFLRASTPPKQMGVRRPCNVFSKKCHFFAKTPFFLQKIRVFFKKNGFFHEKMHFFKNMKKPTLLVKNECLNGIQTLKSLCYRRTQPDRSFDRKLP